MDNTLEQTLATNFGFTAFREGQKEVIENLLENQSCLAIFPTGSGKSLCYQFTAQQLPHLTLVVSPLLALMKDQLSFLQRKGIAADSIDSNQSYADNKHVMQRVKSGEVKILMVSVERFKNEHFRQFIESIPISMLVVDEAHCISEWGHNFRPDYLKLPSYREALNIPLVLLLTATATRAVKHDMAKRFAIEPNRIVQTGFYRSNLAIDVRPVELSNKNTALLKAITELSGCGIVYVSLQKTADNVAEFLRLQGVNAKSYHAGMDDDIRFTTQQQFMDSEVEVIVATIAFGMGVDKPDVRFVIHYDLPKSIENYSQEIGRAGRDGKPSNCITLANLDGITVLENFVFADTPDKESIAALLNSIVENQVDGQWHTQLLPLSNETNVRQLPLKTALVRLEMMGLIQPKYAYYAEFRFKCILQSSAILQKFEGERRAFVAAIFNHSDLKRVWATVDIESLTNDYQCQRSRIVAALDYLNEQHWIELQSKNNTEVFSVDVAGIQQTGLVDSLYQYFAEKERSDINRIQAMIEFFQLSTCLTYQLSAYFDDANAPIECGTCSACLGRPAKLPTVTIKQDIEPQRILQSLGALQQVCQEKLHTIATVGMYCRFLAGLTSPFLTQCRAKSIQGYGMCEGMPYQSIQQLVSELKNDNASN